MWKQTCLIFQGRFSRLTQNRKGSRFLVCWFERFLNKMSKPSKHQRHNLYVRARLKPGWVRWVFHFTFEWLWIFPAQTCQFSRPYFSRNLGRFARGRFPFLFTHPRAYPSAVWRLNGIALSPLLRMKKGVPRVMSAIWNSSFCASCFFVPALFFEKTRKKIEGKFWENGPSFWKETLVIDRERRCVPVIYFIYIHVYSCLIIYAP